RLGNSRMSLEVLAQNYAPLAVDLQHFACPVHCESELFALIRIRCKTLYQSLDLGHQQASAGLDRRVTDRGIKKKPREPAADEPQGERARNRDPSFGVEPQREIRHETVHTPHSVPAGGDQRRTWDTHGRTVAGPRTQQGSQEDCPKLGKYGISWDLVAVKKLSPILAKSSSSTPLTAVKLKETLPDFGTRQVHELCWLDCSAIFTPTAKRLRQPSSMRGAPASAASSFSVTMSGTVRTPASSSIPSCARSPLARWGCLATMMPLSPAAQRT